MKISITHACGHSMVHELYGSSRDRERKIKWLEGKMCPECEEAEYQEEIRKEAKEYGFVELEGSPKQIDWAKRIRHGVFAILEKHIANLEDNINRYKGLANKYADINVEAWNKYNGLIAATQSEINDALYAQDGLASMKEASWWIDHRDDRARDLVVAYIVKVGHDADKAREEEIISMDPIMEPEDRKTETVAMLKANNNYALIVSPKDECIRATVKANGFSWNSSEKAWEKRITEQTGDAKNLLPDTARILLEAGIPVQASTWVMQAVESGNYEPECKRWIDVSSKDRDREMLYISPGAKHFPSGKITFDGGAIVSSKSWRDVRQFAEINGYRITKQANDLLTAAEKATITVKPKAKESEPENTLLQDILNSGADVLEDLLEDD